MIGQLFRKIVTITALLLGAVVGEYLSFVVAYMALEPAERSVFGLLVVIVLVTLLAGLALVARKASGSLGLAGFALVVLLGTVSIGWLTL